MFRFHDYFRSHTSLVIAELANAHEGRYDDVLTMINSAVEAGADALKFQVFFADELLIPNHPKYEMFRKLEMSKEDWKIIFAAAKKSGKLIFIDIFGEESFQFSKQFSVDAYKIHASDMTNFALLDMVSSSGIPLILSAGGCTIDEIRLAIARCEKNPNFDCAIMHGFQNYPTRLEDTDLNVINTLQKEFKCPIGYADHVDGGSELAVILPLLAVAKGAQIIEKHFTLDREQQGIDYQSSVNPDILAKIISLIHTTSVVFGKDQKILSVDEEKYKNDVRKRLVTKRGLKAGDILKIGDITFKRADHGLYAEDIFLISGKHLHLDIGENQVITNSHMGWKK